MTTAALPTIVPSMASVLTLIQDPQHGSIALIAAAIAIVA